MATNEHKQEVQRASTGTDKENVPMSKFSAMSISSIVAIKLNASYNNVNTKLSMRSTVAQLKDEAARRGFEDIPKRKADILCLLKAERPYTSCGYIPAIDWDEYEQFSLSIIRPFSGNKNLCGANMKGYAVWSSVTSYGWLGKVYYQSNAPKTFDTVWATKDEANDRARFLFFWKNCYGISADDLDAPTVDVIEGLKKYSLRQKDSNRKWTAGVVPAIAFKHLDNVEVPPS